MTWFNIGGLSLLDGSAASNAATVFMRVRRRGRSVTDPSLSLQEAILGSLMGKFSQIREAFIVRRSRRRRFAVSVSAAVSRCRSKIAAGVGLDELGGDGERDRGSRQHANRAWRA